MKLFLAGTGGSKLFEKYIKESLYILESFYYIQKWQIPLIKKVKIFLLDSGAFTYMNGKDSRDINWNEYIENYADFINKYDIEYFMELDIDIVVGLEEVEKLRKKLEKLTNKKCIPVWHKSRGLDYWKKMIKEYDYVAIGGIVTGEIKKSEYDIFIPLLKMARQNNCKVHGLGLTSMEVIKKYPFYSVDSTSWTSGGRFGQLHHFNGKEIKSFSRKEKRMKDYRQVNRHNLQEWVKFQEYANKYL